MVVNRVNVDTFKAAVETAKEDPTRGKKSTEIIGEWRLGKVGHQFEAKVPTENGGEFTLRSDETLILGGSGTVPNPIQYCLYGLTACYAATFAKWAAMEGIVLKHFKIKTTVNLDLTRAFGLTQNSIIESLTLEMVIDSDAPIDTLNRLKETAKERSPCYYYASHPISPDIQLIKQEK